MLVALFSGGSRRTACVALVCVCVCVYFGGLLMVCTFSAPIAAEDRLL